VGEIAASIAHEINQPLAAIGADANACLHWLAADRPDLDSVREALTAIVKDGDRAGAVLTRIRTLLARSPVAHGSCDLTAVIREVLSLLGPEIRRQGILLETSLAPDLPPVMGDRIQLQQVLLNSLMNAAQAMRDVPPQRRRIVVRSTVEDRDDGPWGSRRGRGCRGRIRGGRGGPPVRGVLHDKAGWAGHGALDQSLDH